MNPLSDNESGESCHGPHRGGLGAVLSAASVAASLCLCVPAVAAPRAAPIPGGIAIIRLAPGSDAAPQAFFDGRPVLVERRNGAWQAVVGLPLAAQPGEHTIKVVSAGPAGVQEREAGFKIAPHAYAIQRLTIKDAGKVNPPPEALARIEQEAQKMADLRTRFRDLADVDTEFVLPAKGRLSSRFGLRRVLNGEPRSPHGGLDLAIPAGTPVAAPASGVVLEASDFYYCGQAVFVDHGQGLISLYCHLQQTDVKPGQALRRGERIGLSGMSGRATGPHLHWSVYLNGNPVNPELMLPAAR